MDVNKLYEETLPMVLRLINRYPVHGMSEEEVLAELGPVFMDCFDRFDPTRGVKFSTFLYKSCKGTIHKLRKQKTLLSLDDSYGGTQPLLNYITKPAREKFFDAFEDTYKMEDVMRTLDEMPKGYYTRLILFYGVSRKDIARIEGKSDRAVARQHRRNLEKLKKLFPLFPTGEESV